ncbi:uncharacterized protein V1513DRAFT_451174 [Lipomyces chichibuensis]|uniref:uncharacterized protein n=1 Tax=Lipomyces chichibuensis TaxID=1546026 RepID=UPI003343ACF2
MSANLDKSLDEIISQNPSNRRRSRGGLRGARGAAGGGIRKSTSKGTTTRAATQKAAPASSTAMNIENNDKIIISNLPLDVQESAIKDYFNLEIGPVRRCILNYNAKGQSTGVVTMVFQKAGDAARAWKRFNGTPIDGGKKIMHVELVVDPNKKTLADRIQPRSQPNAPVTKATASRTGKATRGRGGVVARGGRGGRGGRAVQARRPKKTTEQLDAEMADYFVQGGNTSQAPQSAPVAAAASAAPVDMGDIPM